MDVDGFYEFSKTVDQSQFGTVMSQHDVNKAYVAITIKDEKKYINLSFHSNLIYEINKNNILEIMLGDEKITLNADSRTVSEKDGRKHTFTSAIYEINNEQINKLLKEYPTAIYVQTTSNTLNFKVYQKKAFIKAIKHSIPDISN